MVLQSEEAKQLKAEANQACLIAARSSADLGKLHAGQGERRMPNDLSLLCLGQDKHNCNARLLAHAYVHDPFDPGMHTQ